MPRLVLDEGVKPLSEFRANVTTLIQQTRKTRCPLVITHHGKPAAVLLGVIEDDSLMQKMEILEDIRLAETQLAQGMGLNHEVALKMVKTKAIRYDIRELIWKIDRIHYRVKARELAILTVRHTKEILPIEDLK